MALYDIWPGNAAGLFLQPRSPHGALNKSFIYVTVQHRHRKMFRTGGEGTEWPDTTMEQGVESGFPTGVEVNISGKILQFREF